MSSERHTLALVYLLTYQKFLSCFLRLRSVFWSDLLISQSPSYHIIYFCELCVYNVAFRNWYFV